MLGLPAVFGLVTINRNFISSWQDEKVLCSLVRKEHSSSELVGGNNAVRFGEGFQQKIIRACPSFWSQLKPVTFRAPLLFFVSPIFADTSTTMLAISLKHASPHIFEQSQIIRIVIENFLYMVFICIIWLFKDVRPGNGRESQKKHAC